MSVRMPALLPRHAMIPVWGRHENAVTWHKLLERVCDVPVTPAPPAAGETRQYAYGVSGVNDVFDVDGVTDVHDVSDLNDRLPGACE
ncbi:MULTISPECIES: hypothetical protein [Streptomyces]|uniref:Uncharacterized protein n=1 Tax=Streptomyces nigra TaxID=1827580 RepID=A0ABZ1J1A2_9ACTN|nr:hypothetical protein [Streptomyces sp. FB2]MCF2537996.1 hypothetical protein [Streptomyces sp. FB2]